jgi:hypothetical protein
VKRIAAFVGKLALALVGMALLTAAGLFVVGAYCATWPILRLPPRQRQLRAGLDVAVALAALVAALGLDGEKVGAGLADALADDDDA